MRQREYPKPGEFYRHFKMKYYQIIAMATHSETGEAMVVYQALYDDFGVYVRPLSLFMSEVDKEKYPQSPQEFRFEKVNHPCVAVECLEKLVPKTETKEEEREDSGESTEDEKNVDMLVQKNVPVEEDNYVMDPSVERFFDARSYKEKLDILMSLRNHLTDKQIHDMAVTLDVTIEDGELDEKYSNLLKCLRTLASFEFDR